MKAVETAWALVFALAAGTLSAQEDWKDTHRVYLRNGSTVDGRLEKSSDVRYLVLAYAPNIRISLKVGEVLRVEAITIRALGNPAPLVEVPRPPAVKPKEEPAKSEAYEKPLDPDIARLVQNPTRKNVQTLMDRLDTISENHRSRILLVLESVDASERIEPSLRRGLESIHPDVRESMIRILAARSDSASIRKFLQLLQDREPWVRAAAAAGVGALGDPSHLESIASLALDSEAQVRAAGTAAARELAGRTDSWAQLGRAWLNLLRRGSDLVRGDLGLALAGVASKAGAEVVEELRSALVDFMTDHSREVRLRAVIAMAEIKDEAAAEAVRTLIEGERVPEIQAEMCTTLTKIGQSSRAIVETLIDLLRSPHPPVRVQAERALKNLTGQMGLESGYDAWSEWFKNSR